MKPGGKRFQVPDRLLVLRSDHPSFHRYSDCCSADFPNRHSKVLPQPTQFRSPYHHKSCLEPLASFVLSMPSSTMANSLARNSSDCVPSFTRGHLNTPASKRWEWTSLENLIRPTRVVAICCYRKWKVRRRRHVNRVSIIQGFKMRELVSVLLNRLCQASQQAATVGG